MQPVPNFKVIRRLLKELDVAITEWEIQAEERRVALLVRKTQKRVRRPAKRKAK